MEAKGPPQRVRSEKKKKSKGQRREAPAPAAAVPAAAAAAAPPPAERKSRAEERPSKKRSSKKASAGGVRHVNPAAEQPRRLAEPQAAPSSWARDRQQVTPAALDQTRAEEVVEEAEDENYEDEEFENYSDDGFEEDPEEDPPTPAPDMEHVASAIKEQNQAAMERRRAGGAKAVPSSSSLSSSSAPAASSPTGEEKKEKAPAPREAKHAPRRKQAVKKYVDFGASIQVRKVQSDDPRLARLKSIQEKVAMEEGRFVAFDQNPQTPLEVYFRRMRGRGLIAQTFTQTNDDARTVEVQTEETATQEQEIQFVFGDDTEFERRLASVRHPCVAADGQPRAFLEQEDVDEANLVRFLGVAGPVVEHLLAELSAGAQGSARAHKGHRVETADGRLVHRAPVSSSRVRLAATTNDLGHFITVHHPVIPEQQECTVLVRWAATEAPSGTRTAMFAEGEALCAELCPGHAHIVVAGTSDGNVLVWDLRLHPVERRRSSPRLVEFDSVPLIPTACDTREVKGAIHEAHTAVVNVSITLMPSAHGNQLLFAQIVSFDDRGLMMIWTLSESVRESGRGTKFRLTRSRSINTLQPSHGGGLSTGFSDLNELVASLGPGPRALGVTFFPTDSNSFLVRTGNERLLRRHRFAEAGILAEYIPEPSMPKSCCEAVAFSQRSPQQFLVACRDGSVRLYDTDLSFPVRTWISPGLERTEQTGRSRSRASEDVAYPVVRVVWSPDEATEFFTLSAQGVLRGYDTHEPLDSELFTTNLLDEVGFGRGGQASHHGVEWLDFQLAHPLGGDVNCVFSISLGDESITYCRVVPSPLVAT